MDDFRCNKCSSLSWQLLWVWTHLMNAASHSVQQEYPKPRLSTSRCATTTVKRGHLCKYMLCSSAFVVVVGLTTTLALTWASDLSERDTRRGSRVVLLLPAGIEKQKPSLLSLHFDCLNFNGASDGWIAIPLYQFVSLNIGTCLNIVVARSIVRLQYTENEGKLAWNRTTVDHMLHTVYTPCGLAPVLDDHTLGTGVRRIQVS